MPLRSTLVIVSLSLALGLAMAIPGGVVVEGRLDSPPSPGMSTAFTIGITKGGLEYFGRILISLPKDCRLRPKQLHGGGITYDEERSIAVISWLKLPEPDQFELLLDLEVSPNAAPGPRSIEWDFSFIRNNDRVTLRPAPFHFEVVPQPGHSTSPTVAETRTSDRNPAVVAPLQTGVFPQALRSITPLRDGGAEVRITISNLPEGGFVKLVEKMPQGCAVEVVSGGGSVSQITGEEARFLWFDYQKAGSLIYQVKHCSLSNFGSIIGVLSFIEGDNPREIDVIQIEGELPTVPIPPDLATSGGDVSFGVQVAATKKAVVTDYFKQRLDFRLPLSMEEDAGWVKYLNGSFTDYREARDHREAINARHAFIGPFVVARKRGRRISVQEALMLTGQEWRP